MKNFLILCFSSLILSLFTACAAPQDASNPDIPRGREAPRTEIILPPDFGPSTAVSGERSCGGMVAGPAQTCGANEYCHREISDQCGAADAPGVCRSKPEVCTMDYTPVCGCDGKTYSNECAANAQGVSAASMGECP